MRSTNPAFRDAIIDRYIDLSRQAIGAGAAARHLARGVDAVLLRRRRGAGRADPAAGDRIAHAVHHRHRRVRAGRAAARPDRFYNAAVLRRRRRPNARRRTGRCGSCRSASTCRSSGCCSSSGRSSKPSATSAPAPSRSCSTPTARASAWRSATSRSTRGSRARSSSSGSQLLATITNDAWFGRSSAAYQHFEQGAIRAVEEGRYLVRAANTGISGAVDPYGRVLVADAAVRAGGHHG